MISGIDMKRLIAVLLLGGVGLAAATAHAADATDAAQAGWGLPQLMRELAQVKTAKGHFVEKRYISILNGPLESSGTLLYNAPDRLEKNTLLPSPERMLLEGDRLTLDSEARNEHRSISLKEYPEIGAFVESIRSTLAGDMQVLNRLYTVFLEGNAREWKLLLRPNEPKMKAIVTAILIGGSRNWVHTIEIRETGGDRSVMTVVRDAP
jgi:hypothetical protein